MADDLTQVVMLLSSVALFRSLRPEMIQEFAGDFEALHFLDGETIYAPGDRPAGLYIVQSGKVRLVRQDGDRVDVIATLVAGDFFGEEALIYNLAYPFAANAAGSVRLLRLPVEHFASLVRKYPYIRSYLFVTANSRRMARGHRYDWLSSGESIHLITRKYVAFLLISLIKPVLLGLVAAIAVYIGFIAGAASLRVALDWIGGVTLCLAALWGIWVWIDWGNDFYIVTNQRVIWLEKVIGIYDSRQEAPLNTILTVGTQIDQFGYWLGYGDVIIRTYTGQIVMHKVNHPAYLANIVREQQDRNKVVVKEVDTALLEQAIRKRLGIPDPAASKPTVSPTTAPLKPAEEKSGILGNFFKVRYEQKDVVTYRKHWILLLRGIWLPTLGMLTIIAFMAARLLDVYSFPSLLVLWLTGITFLFIIFLVWVYRYADWRNDIYQLTNDQILDIYRKPLGREDKKTADLENILSLQHQRYGIIGLILNYGDVVAMVGATRFVFTGVYNPASVEQEIFERINARKKRKKDADDVRERERIADWLAAYYSQTETLRRAQNNPGSEQKSG
jgi:hypothetical protein